VDAPLSGANRRVVDEALEAVAAGDFDRAGELLRDRFESVCERRTPALGDADHPAACHLYDDDGGEVAGEGEPLTTADRD
jgi:peptide/nickel transport system ATP-binding protein